MFLDLLLHAWDSPGARIKCGLDTIAGAMFFLFKIIESKGNSFWSLNFLNHRYPFRDVFIKSLVK